MSSFADLQDDAALMSFEHQLHLTELLGLPSWQANFVKPSFELTQENGESVSCTDVQLLGSAAPGPGSWLWSWASPGDDYAEDVLLAAQEVRRFGEEHGIAELAEPEVPFDALPGSPTDPAKVTSLMMEASKAVTGRFTGYQGPVGRGTRIGLLIDHPTFRLPAAEGRSASSVLRRGLHELFFHDQRRGVHAYADRREGLDLAMNDATSRISGPGFTVDLRFNERNQFVVLSTQFDS